MPIYKFRLAGPPHQSDDIAKSVQVDFHHTQIQMIERAAIPQAAKNSRSKCAGSCRTRDTLSQATAQCDNHHAAR
jgi:hypothetical protein